MSTATETSFETVGDFQRVYDGHFFARDTMRFFASRVCNGGRMIGGRFFITSEKACFDDYRRVYHVRAVRRTPEGDGGGRWTIDSYGEAGKVGAAPQADFATLRAAIRCAERLAAAEGSAT